MSKSKDERLADVRRQIEAVRDALDAMEREIDALSARQSRGDGAIRCLPSGRWQAKVKVGGTYRVAPQTFATKSEAQEWADAHKDGQPQTELDDLFGDLPERCTPKDIIDRGIRSRSQLNRDIAAGRLPAYRLGQRLFIRKADVLALVRPAGSGAAL